MNTYEGCCPCDSCEMYDHCDGWDAQFCCTLCEWLSGDETPCDICNPADI